MNIGKTSTINPPNHVFDAQLDASSDLTLFFDSHKLTTQTEFLRMRSLYSDLVNRILPRIVPGKVAADKPLRIWSAGCSDGREPYSIAMVIHDYLSKNQRGKFIPVEIRASDIAPAQIDIARQGKYQLKKSDWPKLNSFKDYFKTSADESQIVIQPSLKNWIEFRVEDIARLEFRGGFDIITCAHVLLYYEQNYSRFILSRLLRKLAPGGFIYLEPVSFKVMRSLGMKRLSTVSHFFHSIEKPDLPILTGTADKKE